MLRSIGATAVASVLALSLTLDARAQNGVSHGYQVGGQPQGAVSHGYQVGGRYHHEWRGERRHHHHGGGNAGGAIAAGVVGLMLGAALSNANRYDPPPAPMPYRNVDNYIEPYGGHDWAAYCSQKFSTYDPATGMYLAGDGRRYPCH